MVLTPPDSTPFPDSHEEPEVRPPAGCRLPLRDRVVYEQQPDPEARNVVERVPYQACEGRVDDALTLLSLAEWCSSGR
jgi:hypothetical protein